MPRSYRSLYLLKPAPGGAGPRGTIDQYYLSRHCPGAPIGKCQYPLED
jgi:hypothetical protein